MIDKNYRSKTGILPVSRNGKGILPLHFLKPKNESTINLEPIKARASLPQGHSRLRKVYSKLFKAISEKKIHPTRRDEAVSEGVSTINHALTNPILTPKPPRRVKVSQS